MAVIHKSFLPVHEIEMPLTEATWVSQVPAILQSFVGLQRQEIYVNYFANRLTLKYDALLGDGPFVPPKNVIFGFVFIQPMTAILEDGEKICHSGDFLVTTESVKIRGIVHPGIAYYICIGMLITDEPESGECIGECPVCYDPMYKFRTTMCTNHHQVCLKCSANWSRKGRASCPLCRDRSIYRCQGII